MPAPEAIKQYSPDEPKPLGGYAILLLTFHALVALLVGVRLRSRKKLPETIPVQDIALLSVGTFKLSRLITKDKVTAAMRAPFTEYQEPGGPAEVKEKPRGEGLQRAVGELLVCPYCIGQWVATFLLAAYIWQPRLTRAAASLFAVVTGADYMQQLWVAVDKAA
jgi:Protein of unknown function (DUF1360)